MSNIETTLASVIVPEEIVKPKRRKLLIPRNTVDLLSVAKRVVVSWEDSGYPLSWETSAGLRTKIEKLEIAVSQKKSSSTTRNPVTVRLKELKKETNDALSIVKLYIREEYGNKDSVSHYAEFGIIHLSGSYRFPISHEERLDSLNDMVTAMAKYSFSDRKFGLLFWTDLRDEYKQMLELASSKDSNTTMEVGNQQKYKDAVYTTLHSLSKLIEANHPDDFQRVKRVWGFHKEKN